MGDVINLRDYLQIHCIGLSCPYKREKTVLWQAGEAQLVFCEDCPTLAEWDEGVCERSQ